MLCSAVRSAGLGAFELRVGKLEVGVFEPETLTMRIRRGLGRHGFRGFRGLGV